MRQPAPRFKNDSPRSGRFGSASIYSVSGTIYKKPGQQTTVLPSVDMHSGGFGEQQLGSSISMRSAKGKLMQARHAGASPIVVALHLNAMAAGRRIGRRVPQ
jgi:hypothetical protein